MRDSKTDGSIVELLSNSQMFRQVKAAAETEQLQERQQLIAEIQDLEAEQAEVGQANKVKAEAAGLAAVKKQKEHVQAQKAYHRAVAQGLHDSSRLQSQINRCQAKLRHLLPTGYQQTIADLQHLLNVTRGEIRSSANIRHPERSNAVEINSKLADIEAAIANLEGLTAQAVTTEQLRQEMAAVRDRFNLAYLPGRRKIDLAAVLK
jgi:hypothetical protein